MTKPVDTAGIALSPDLEKLRLVHRRAIATAKRKLRGVNRTADQARRVIALREQAIANIEAGRDQLDGTGWYYDGKPIPEDALQQQEKHNEPIHRH